MNSQPLMLDAQTQVSNEYISPPSTPHSILSTTVPVDVMISTHLDQVHMNLVSRINELEMQNYDLQKNLKEIGISLHQLKTMWEVKIGNEKDSDLLLRNLGILR